MTISPLGELPLASCDDSLEFRLMPEVYVGIDSCQADPMITGMPLSVAADELGAPEIEATHSFSLGPEHTCAPLEGVGSFGTVSVSGTYHIKTDSQRHLCPPADRVSTNRPLS